MNLKKKERKRKNDGKRVSDSLPSSHVRTRRGSLACASCCFFPRSLLCVFSLGLPFAAATSGRAAALIGLHRALCRRRAPNRYALPFSSVPAVRNGAPQTLIQAICCRICNILASSFDFVCKNYLACMCTPISYAGSAPDQVIFFSSACMVNPPKRLRAQFIFQRNWGFN